MASIILDDYIAEEELEEHHKKYKSSIESNKGSSLNVEFQYALCLIRSQHRSKIQEGYTKFKYIFDNSKDEDMKRDALFYMAVGHAKLKNYEPALKYLEAILKVQTTNEQVRDLYVEVNKRMRKDGLIGIGIVGGAAAVGFAGLVGLGLALFAKKK